MARLSSENHGQIRVADITIAQLSRGLYRSTATAFKELVSNAYDADATVVRIDTNYPEFDYMSCVDNGSGMTVEQFLRYFSKEGIGTCVKRKHHKQMTPIHHRPIIGRLGIGMLAIGQLCHSFELESHYEEDDGEGKAYRARIVLADLNIPDKEILLTNDNEKRSDMQVGNWEYEVIDYDKKKKGFRIYSSDVRNTFRREMKSSVEGKQSKKMSFKLAELHSQFYDRHNKSVRDCKPYLETIWELSTLCPLPYYGQNPDEYPIKLKCPNWHDKSAEDYSKAVDLMRSRQTTFLGQEFSVIFDGITLRRHVQLPTEADAISKLYFIHFDDKVFDSLLSFSGYLFAQIPHAVKPLELNGVQIRLKGVGIGGYDSTFLRYSRQIETIRSKWVSGEIFVDAGLESALNIDRDSFNEHDEHFKTLQDVLHDKLNIVFGEIDTIARTRSEQNRDTKEHQFGHKLESLIHSETSGRFKLVRRQLDPNDAIVSVDHKGRVITLNTAARPTKKKKPDLLIRSVMLAYYAAKNTTSGEEERERRFRELVIRIIGEVA